MEIKRNWFMTHPILFSFLGVVLLFFLMAAIGAIVSDPTGTKYEAERSVIRKDLIEWCRSLNDPTLGGSANDLKNANLLTILSRAGSKWGFDRYNLEKMPEHVTLVGWVPSYLWQWVRYEDKRYLLLDLEMSLQEKTHQMTRVSRDQIGLLPFSIEIRDIHSNKLLAKRSQSVLLDRFKFYE